MKALVIGGTGFIGLNIIQALKADGHDVVATRRASSNTIFLRRLKVPMRQVDLEVPSTIRAALEGCDTVFFTAGHYPRLSIDTEGQLTRAVLRLHNTLDAVLQAGIRRFVYTGSVATVAQAQDGELASEQVGMLHQAPPGSTYYAIKLALELEVLAAARRGLDVVTLLPTGCFGPFDHKVGTGFFVVAMANAALPAYVDGRINIVDVRDVATAHVAAALHAKTGERYILGGHNLTVAALLHELAQLCAVPLPLHCMPPDEALRFAIQEEARCQGTPERPGLSREMVDMALHGQFVDSSKARIELGFAPRPLEETLRDSIGWFRQNGYIRRTTEGGELHVRRSPAAC